MTREELQKEFPALAHAVYDRGAWWRPTESCEGCPFKGAQVKNSAPVEPGYSCDIEQVVCKLQGVNAWPDEPTCTEMMWRRKAVEELDAAGKRLPLTG